MFAADRVTCPAVVFANAPALMLLLAKSVAFPKAGVAAALDPKAEDTFAGAEPKVEPDPKEGTLAKAETGTLLPLNPNADVVLLPKADCGALDPKPELLPKPP